MPISSNALFHFTSTFRQLGAILENKFKLTYCYEKYSLGHETHESYYPMVSFCDIPLSIAHNQVKAYGNYAIGLTKEWAIKNKLNPVLYIEKNSHLSVDLQAKVDNLFNTVRSIAAEIARNTNGGITIIKKIINDAILDKQASQTTTSKILTPRQTEQLMQILTNISNTNDGYKALNKLLEQSANNLWNIFRYIKNYEGPHPKTSGSKMYRFYDEREWRYVPEFYDVRFKPALNKQEFVNFRGIGKKPFIKDVILNFSSRDIKYLLVKSESEIPKLIRFIKKIETLTKSSDDADILSTRIITINQVFSDF